MYHDLHLKISIAYNKKTLTVEHTIPEAELLYYESNSSSVINDKLDEMKDELCIMVENIDMS